MKTRKCLLGFCLAFLVISGLWATANTDELYSKKLDFKKEVYNKTLQFVQRNPNTSDVAKLWFNIAELSTEVDAADNDKIAGYYRKVIQLDPEFPDRDIVFYNIGYYSYLAIRDRIEEQRRNYLAKFTSTEEFSGRYPVELLYTENSLREVIDAYKQVIDTFPNSRYTSQSIIRLGNAYREIGYDNPDDYIDVVNPTTNQTQHVNRYYSEAGKYFRMSIERKDNMSVYGLFLSGLNTFYTGESDKAIQYFSSTLDSLNNSKNNVLKSLEGNSLDYIADCLMEFDSSYTGSSTAAQLFRETFSKMVTPENGKLVLKQAFALKMRYNAPRQAVEFYNTYVTLYPDAVDAPCILDSLINVTLHNEMIDADAKQDKEFREQTIRDARKRLVENYNLKSSWYAKNKDNDITAQLSIVRKAFDNAEINYYNEACDHRSEANYNAYLTFAENYLSIQENQGVVTDKKRSEVQNRVLVIMFDKADLSKNPVDYWTAALMLRDYDDTHANNDSLFSYETRAYKAVENIYTILSAKPDSVFTDSAAKIRWDRTALDSLYVTASLRYEKTFQNPRFSGKMKNADLVIILFNRAKVYYDRKDFDNAYVTYQAVLDKNPDDKMKETAYNRMAEIAYNRGGKDNYQLAQNFYEKAAAVTKNAETKSQYEKNRRVSLEKRAGSMQGAEAAQVYIQLAEENQAKDVPLTLKYYNDAITVNKNAGMTPAAIDIYLKIAKIVTQKEQVIAAYQGAYNLADSTKDYQRGEQLRRDLITQLNTRFPGSIEAFSLECEIIGRYEKDPFNNKARAQELWIDLHKRAIATKMNTGESKPADIYFTNVIRLDKEMGNEQAMIEHIMAFDKMYPKDPRSNVALGAVAEIYIKGNQDAKLNDLALYMYKKDPADSTISGIYKNLASKQISENLNSAADAFEHKDATNLKPTMDSIASFRKQYDDLVKKYTANGLKLKYDVGYNQYKFFSDYFAYHTSLQNAINDARNGFLKTDPNTLFLVGAKTTWQGHINGGKNYPGKVAKAAEDRSAALFKVLTDGTEKNMDVPMAKRAEVLYLCGQINDYAAEMIATQVEKFIKVSNEVKQFKNDEAGYNEAVTMIHQMVPELQAQAFANAVYFYNLCVDFSDKMNYKDEWTEKSLARLHETGARREEVKIDMMSDSSWRITAQNMTDPGYLESANWSRVSSTTLQAAPADYPGLSMISVPRDHDQIIRKAFDTKMLPDRVELTYFFDAQIELYLNGVLVETIPDQDTLGIDGKVWNRYRVMLANDIQIGGNTIAMRIPMDSAVAASNLMASIRVVYEKTRYQSLQNSTMFRIIADDSWMTSIATIDPLNPVVIDSLWSVAGTDHFGFGKAQLPSMATQSGIWSKDANAQTVWFYKEVELADPVVESTLRFYADQKVSIWINQTQLNEDEEMMIDPVTGLHSSVNMMNLPFVQGKNTILIKVTGGESSRGLLFDLNGITQK
jgi:hypothetical protein